ncbi:hypothetical protein HY229_06115 [Candidatus Acetothermia bacterium]|nr:hypothetical protein [Candidatus Acetothermia bacterium]MBI3643656.1 hypothetical protein [Candidatus Acetothermia bacterium]
MNQYQVAVAAEAIAAALFARCGCDVSVQYGANQPGYDLIVAKNDKLLKVSVKGSQDGSWGLTQSYVSGDDYHAAAKCWLEDQDPQTLFCFVQYKGTDLKQMPHVYLAWPHEVYNRLCETRKGRGDTILYEIKKWTDRAYAAGTIDKIPKKWEFSQQRIEALFKES